MAEIDDDRLQQIHALTENVEGYIADAEFRDDQDVKTIRYLQATSAALLAIINQNKIIIELLSKRELP